MAVAPERDRGVFLGVGVEDREGAGIAVGDRVLGARGCRTARAATGDGAKDRAARGGTAQAADAAAKRPDPKLLKSSSPLSAATWRGLFGEGRLAGNGYRPVKPTNPVVPSGALGRTMANSGPQRRAGPAKAAAITVRGLTTSPSLPRHPPTSPDARTSASAPAPRSGRGAGPGGALAAAASPRRHAGAVARQAEGEPDLVVHGVEVGDLMQLALVIGDEREIGEVHRELLGQPDGALALADQAAQAPLAPLPARARTRRSGTAGRRARSRG